MKQSIEALRWLFGDEWSVETLRHNDDIGVLISNEDDLSDYDSFDACNNAYICRLIDEALLKREDVASVNEITTRHHISYDIRMSDPSTSYVELFGGDPLTARLEAVNKLYEASK